MPRTLAAKLPARRALGEPLGVRESRFRTASVARATEGLDSWVQKSSSRAGSTTVADAPLMAFRVPRRMEDEKPIVGGPMFLSALDLFKPKKEKEREKKKETRKATL